MPTLSTPAAQRSGHSAVKWYLDSWSPGDRDKVGRGGSTDVTLQPGDSTTLTLDLTAEATTVLDNVGTHEVRAVTSDDRDTGSLEVFEPDPYFAVSAESTNGPLEKQSDTPGKFKTTVTNTDNGDGRQTIEFLPEGSDEPVGSQTVELDPGESTELTFEWSNASEEAGTRDVTVRSENESDDAQVEVQDVSRSASVALDLAGPSTITDGEIVGFSVVATQQYIETIGGEVEESWEKTREATRSDFEEWTYTETGREGGFSYVAWDRVKATKVGDARLKTELTEFDFEYDGWNTIVPAAPSYWTFTVEEDDDGGSGPPGGCSVGPGGSSPFGPNDGGGSNPGPNDDGSVDPNECIEP